MREQKINLKSLSSDEVIDFLKGHNCPKYRGLQLMRWIYKKYARNIHEITEFSKELRGKLDEIAYIGNLDLKKNTVSSDGTRKLLFSLEDRNTIETVLIPETDRITLCVSSQVGCAMGCVFCVTGKGGLRRNLKHYEIVDQIISVNRIISPQKVTNVVFMGMGEPLANFNGVIIALWSIVQLLGISRRKITVSTSGIVPGITGLSRSAPGVNLAVSLNATTDSIREKIMPVNRKYPLKSLISACRAFPLPQGRRITFEYVLIKGLNDAEGDALRLVHLLKGIRCKVNLIPLNPYRDSGLSRPSDKEIFIFQKLLTSHRLKAFIREGRGRDILAACGQLKAVHT
jgi:23S rRNA (adenine2503-C2)-methyltransferase